MTETRPIIEKPIIEKPIIEKPIIEKPVVKYGMRSIGVLVLLCCLMFIIEVTSDLLDAFASRDWPQADGGILSVEAEPVWQEQGKQKLHFKIEYEYTVNGERHRGSRIDNRTSVVQEVSLDELSARFARTCRCVTNAD